MRNENTMVNAGTGDGGEGADYGAVVAVHRDGLDDVTREQEQPPVMLRSGTGGGDAASSWMSGAGPNDPHYYSDMDIEVSF